MEITYNERNKKIQNEENSKNVEKANCKNDDELLPHHTILKSKQTT